MRDSVAMSIDRSAQQESAPRTTGECRQMSHMAILHTPLARSGGRTSHRGQQM